VMTGLRTKWGVNFKDSIREFPQEWIRLFEKKAQEMISKKWLQQNENTFRLTEKGKFFADGIAAEFFVD